MCLAEIWKQASSCGLESNKLAADEQRQKHELRVPYALSFLLFGFSHGPGVQGGSVWDTF